MPEGESSERPGGARTGVSTLLEGKGLFGHATPQRENSTWYPIQVMSQLQSDLAMRAYRNRQDTARAEKLTAWKESLHKVEMAYEIIAYPRLIGSGYELHLLAVALTAQTSMKNPSVTMTQWQGFLATLSKAASRRFLHRVLANKLSDCQDVVLTRANLPQVILQ
jgi:hypothetical protein